MSKNANSSPMYYARTRICVPCSGRVNKSPFIDVRHYFDNLLSGVVATDNFSTKVKTYSFNSFNTRNVPENVFKLFKVKTDSLIKFT